jgi:hypothetical protein
MGNYRMERCRSHINTSPPIVLKVVVIKTQNQHVGIGVT